MGLKLSGSTEYLYDAGYEAEVLVDTWTSNDIVWIMPPQFYQSQSGYFREVVKVLTAPVNQNYAQDLVDKHNEIYNSPLAKALRETDED